MNRTAGLLLIIIATVVVAAGIALILSSSRFPQGGSTGGSIFPPFVNLPAGCVKPTSGFLVIANQNGFNDSIQHGAPTKQWPIIVVKQGTTVNITVCNADIQAHGFQIAHHYDSSIETVAPGQVIHVSFLADRVGDFEIYCSIPCTIHVYMQNGLFQVTA